EANQEYRDMIIASETKDITYTAAISGVSANFLSKSLDNAGITQEQIESKGKIDFGKEMDTEAKAWKTIWSAGQGVTTIENNLPIKELLLGMKTEFKDAIARQQAIAKKYN
ncbi:MAG: nitronate monooxygenase, partial [Patiriisocius sp.]